MATAGLEALIELANAAPAAAVAVAATAPSNISSPLSDFDDADDVDGGPMDLDINRNDEEEASDEGGSSPPAQIGSPESNLSELEEDDEEEDDSEAETERLHNTPHGIKNIHDKSNAGAVIDAPGRRPRLFQPSPSKLQAQIQAEGDAQENSEDDAGPSEDDDDDTQPAVLDNLSVGGSAITPSRTSSRTRQALSQPPLKRSQRPSILNTDRVMEEDDIEEDSRPAKKQKRSQGAEDSESDAEEEPDRGKRAGSVLEEEEEEEDDDAELKKQLEEEEVPKTTSRAQFGNEGEEEVGLKNTSEQAAVTPEDQVMEDAIVQDNDAASTQGPSNQGTVLGTEAEDDDAELAHKNEAELERKRAAFEHLSTIEKQFTSFRERLYEDRLIQLNKEEALLKSKSPTHPEFMAMAQCIEKRLSERLEKIDLELQFTAKDIEHWAVARRAEVLSQYFQSVRETRELALEGLGKQWYEIQHERRRHANTIPDFGFRFPRSKTEQKRHAIAYNKEVSILAGVAKYKGFPAAPEMRGATVTELEEDMAAMTRARQPTIHQAHAHQPQAAFHEYNNMAFGRNLGPAGEQFIEQTPWANPNHPSHQLPRQHSQQHHGSGPSRKANPRLGGQRIDAGAAGRGVGGGGATVNAGGGSGGGGGVGSETLKMHDRPPRKEFERLRREALPQISA